MLPGCQLLLSLTSQKHRISDSTLPRSCGSRNPKPPASCDNLPTSPGSSANSFQGFPWGFIGSWERVGSNADVYARIGTAAALGRLGVGSPLADAAATRPLQRDVARGRQAPAPRSPPMASRGSTGLAGAGGWSRRSAPRRKRLVQKLDAGPLTAAPFSRLSRHEARSGRDGSRDRLSMLTSVDVQGSPAADVAHQ